MLLCSLLRKPSAKVQFFPTSSYSQRGFVLPICKLLNYRDFILVVKNGVLASTKSRFTMIKTPIYFAETAFYFSKIPFWQIMLP